MFSFSCMETEGQTSIHHLKTSLEEQKHQPQNQMEDLLYGSEAWKQTKKNEQDLKAFINKCIRQILNAR
jgi:hypothetical protein